MKNYPFFTPVLIVILIIAILVIPKKAPQKSLPARTIVSSREYRRLKPTLRYIDSFPELDIKNLTMIGRVGRFGVDGDRGKLLRVLRFQNISDAVELRYNLPRNIILAMVMEESSGVDLLPNALGDGGFGLCHMQASVAREFGLSVYKNCNALVCNGTDRRSCRDGSGHLFNHAHELKERIEQSKSNRRAVIGYDDRLNPLLNLDAVGRMLASFMSGPRCRDLGPLQTAIARYAGLYNYNAYWRDVQHNMAVLENRSTLASIEREFNVLNPYLNINGIPADFNQYIKLSQNQNYNYGLASYMLLPPYLPRNSDIVLASLEK